MAQSQPSSATPESRFCGAAPQPNAKPRVVIGRFLQFGEFDPSLERNLEYAFSGTLAGSLLSHGDVEVFVWGRDPEQARQFKDFGEQINNAFATGAPRDAQRKALAAALTAHNCHYLLAGRVSRDGDQLVLSTYRLRADEARIERLTPVFGDLPVLLRAADRLAAELGSFLRRRRVVEDASRVVEAGCISVVERLPVSDAEIELLSAAMRQRLIQALSNERRFRVRPASDKTVCSGDERAGVDVTLTLSARLRRGAGETIAMHPEVSAPDSMGGNLVSIGLPSTARAPSDLVGLPAIYADGVRTFLLVVTRQDGSLPEEFSSPPLLTYARLWDILEQDLQEQNSERAALAAYRVLAIDPDNPIALYMLGRVLLEKAQPKLALDHLLRAWQRPRPGWKPEMHAALKEWIANAQRKLNGPSAGIETYREARALYAQAGKSADAKRVGRSLADALFRADEKDRAFEELRKQPDLESDIESLRMLGEFASRSDQYADAAIWLRKALTLNPNDEGSRSSLAEVYEAIGQQNLSARRYVEARANFDLATDRRDSARTRYRGALAAYELNELADAAARLEKVVADRFDEFSATYHEASWLTLLEIYLLLGRYDQLDQRFAAANEFLGQRPDSRLLAAYIAFIGKVAGYPHLTVSDLTSDPIYRQIFAAPPSASAANLSGWDNTAVANHLARLDLSQDKRALLNGATERVWRDTKKLQ